MKRILDEMSAGNSWSCPACTFINDPFLLYCEMCEQDKPDGPDSAAKPDTPPNTQNSVDKIVDQLAEYRNRHKKNHQAVRSTPAVAASSTPLPLEFANHHISACSLNLLCKILNKDHLQKAVFSSFVYDMVWFKSLIPPNIKLVLCQDYDMNPSIAEQFPKEKPRYVKLSGNHTIVFPPKKSRGCMHTKFMILFFDGFVRIVISTGNLIEADYNGMMANMLFVQDFPKAESEFVENGFISGFLQALKDLYIPETIIDQLQEYDYSLAKGRVVSSKPISCSQDSPEFYLYGIPALSRIQSEIIKNENFGFKNIKKIQYLTSSLGALTFPWLSMFSAAAAGEQISPKCHQHHAQDCFQLLFPTVSQVENSYYGPNGAGTIRFNDQYYTDRFPKAIMHSPVMGRQLSHGKLMYCEFNREDSSNEKAAVFGSLYLGSHNFTASAWGTVKFLVKKVKLDIFNYEMGLVLPIEKGEVKLPYSSVQKYSNSDKPWSV